MKFLDWLVARSEHAIKGELYDRSADVNFIRGQLDKTREELDRKLRLKALEDEADTLGRRP